MIFVVGNMIPDLVMFFVNVGLFEISILCIYLSSMWAFGIIHTGEFLQLRRATVQRLL